MQLRDFQPKDLNWVLSRIKEEGYEYELPRPELFLEKRVVEDDTGNPIMVLAALPTAEMYLIVDPNWETPGQRLEVFKLMHEDMRRKMEEKKIVFVHAWLPPKIYKSFGRRLCSKMFFWYKPLWNCVARRII